MPVERSLRHATVAAAEIPARAASGNFRFTIVIDPQNKLHNEQVGGHVWYDGVDIY